MQNKQYEMKYESVIRGMLVCLVVLVFVTFLLKIGMSAKTGGITRVVSETAREEREEDPDSTLYFELE